MEKKSVFKSKTFWVSLIVAIAPAIPGLREWMVTNPEAFSAAIGAVFAGLRLITNSKVTLNA